MAQEAQHANEGKHAIGSGYKTSLAHEAQHSKEAIIAPEAQHANKKGKALLLKVSQGAIHEGTVDHHPFARGEKEPIDPERDWLEIEVAKYDLEEALDHYMRLKKPTRRREIVRYEAKKTGVLQTIDKLQSLLKEAQVL